MKVLVDTSVWSLALRRGEHSIAAQAQELRQLIQDHRVHMIGPIRQEILSGIRSDSQLNILKKHLESFAGLPILTDDYVRAAKFFNLCHSKGVQGSNTDFLICSVAVRNNLSIFTTDQDFKLFSKHIKITLHQAENSNQADSADAKSRTVGERVGPFGPIVTTQTEKNSKSTRGKQ
jgi:predicted nucleic acid-binding protein